MTSQDFKITVSENSPSNIILWNKLAEKCGNIWQATFYDEVQLFFNNHAWYFECYNGEELIGGVKIYFYESKKLPAILRSISKRATQGSEFLFDRGKNEFFEIFNALLYEKIKKWLEEKKMTSFFEYSFFGETEKLISLGQEKKIWESNIGIAKIDLTKSIKSLWSAVDQTHRGKVIKAEKNKVAIVWSDEIDLFFTLMDETYKNQKGHVPNKKFIRYEYEILKSNNSAQLVFASHEGKYLCGALLYNFGKISIYNFAGTIKNNLGAGQLLHWEIIKRLKDKGYQSYFLGETSFEKNDANLKFTQGITKFKLRFGAAQIPTFHKEYALYPMKLKIWKLLQKIFIRK